jgi:hypothetical protein
MSQKIVLFISTALGTSNPTNLEISGCLTFPLRETLHEVVSKLRQAGSILGKKSGQKC